MPVLQSYFNNTIILVKKTCLLKRTFNAKWFLRDEWITETHQSLTFERMIYDDDFYEQPQIHKVMKYFYIVFYSSINNK